MGSLTRKNVCRQKQEAQGVIHLNSFRLIIYATPVLWGGQKRMCSL